MIDFANALKTWRKARRLSQLELAVEANVSARHIAFLETARARPSASMIARLSDVLQMPLTARNQMLTLAGFAARYPKRQWDGAEMAPVKAAVTYMLDAHKPYPALAVDRDWKLIAMNSVAAALFGPIGMVPGASLLDIMQSDLMPQMIENWPEVAHYGALRLRTESAAQGGVQKLEDVAEKLSAVGALKPKQAGPVVPIIFRFGLKKLSLFAVLAQFGTPEDEILDDLKIELYFPYDGETEHVLRELAVSL